MEHSILLTGATGFLGSQIAKRLVSDGDHKVFVLIRPNDENEALKKLKGSWAFDKTLSAAIGRQFFIVQGDFTKEGLGLKDEDKRMLQDEVKIIIHAGADVSFQKDEADLFKTNTIGTKNMIAFGKTIEDLKRFVYVSTAYVAGTGEGLIKEETVQAPGYANSYESSKAEAEQAVLQSSLPYTICRPGMIVGDSKSGYIKNFNTIYYLLRQLLLKKLPIIPARSDILLNLVPVDYVAEMIVKAAFEEKTEGKIFHLTCPEKQAPKAEELSDHVCDWAKKNLDIEVRKPFYLSLPFVKKMALDYGNKKEGKQKDFYHNMLTVAPYFYSDQKFDRSNTDTLLGEYDLQWREYIDVLLDFACRKNFMRQDGNTVFEQAMLRRASRSHPITYYDVKEDRIEKMEGDAANERILQIKEALLKWGIRKGDRVALTGINSIDYMLLEQAIGLTGAVSVPIYYTSPAKETSLLLKKSGAGWFFIGDKRMMSSLNEIETEARIVVFSVVKDMKDERVLSFDDFLAKAQGPYEEQYPFPEDLATIRYTSGTTGEPKGVMFDFGQLGWMGEVLTSLLTFKDRNDSMVYLSFLPLSHVVEGILASYAPYYVLCKVDYYYLNDFGALTASLPKVRPNIFFSVPRFYEKVWDQVCSNPIGRIWLKMNDGLAKSIIGKILKKAVLKKAGLDRCRQLIVGSAPISEQLLLNFRSLGIEIHNAYGQTEAPLITINRLGDNIIPSIGTPLPETKVSVEEDGELIVEGPQVTLGYYGLQSPNISNGVLRTGDLGSVDDKGHITLFGRKKDFVVTSYGKNISIPKLEEALKDIPGVSEAVMIGEGKPYCTALLWLEGEVKDLDAQIAKMNEKLSHPEQIRKYKVIETPLSIGKEELTPNLKVKRNNVMKHYEDVIREMYS